MANIHLASITLAITLWGSPPLDSTNPQPTYYDNRERIAVKMTFEWTETSRVQYPVEFIRRHNEMTRNYLLSLFQSAEAQDQSVEVSPEELDALMSEARIDEKVADMVFETSAHYLIERELRRTRIRARQAVINLNEAKVSEQPHESEIYLQDSLVITVFSRLCGRNGQRYPSGAVRRGSDRLRKPYSDRWSRVAGFVRRRVAVSAVWAQA
jgi:hypothetical protein